MEHTIYHSEDRKSALSALRYSKTHASTHRFLAYKNIPAILNKYLNGKKALDYGAGTGYSTQFLYELDLDVVGVDVSEEMLSQAHLNYPHLSFYHLQNQNSLFLANTFDLVFSSFVLFEMGTEREIIDYLLEAKRIMRKDALFIGISGSQDLHSTARKWVNFYTGFPENENLKSGNLVKLHLYDSAMDFTDYYWTEADYLKFFRKTGFQLIEIHYPLGDKNDPYDWKDEVLYSPFVIFVAREKPCNEKLFN